MMPLSNGEGEQRSSNPDEFPYQPLGQRGLGGGLGISVVSLLVVGELFEELVKVTADFYSQVPHVVGLYLNHPLSQHPLSVGLEKRLVVCLRKYWLRSNDLHPIV